MSAEINRETDRLLGQLVADGAEHKRQLSACFQKLDALSRDLSEHSGVAKEALRLASEIAAEIKADITPTIDDYKSLKAKGAGVLAFIALLGAGLATGLQKLWSAMSGPNGGGSGPY